MGLFEPVKLSLRLMFVSMLENEWDIPLNENIIETIEVLREEILRLNELRITRRFDTGATLTCFTDASQVGYGYAIYLENRI